MAEAVLRTKLFVPRLRAEFVDRPALVDRLRAGESGRLSLICGPAGFGKTSVASSWLSKTDRQGVWLSLDEHDNDLTRFFSCLVATARQVDGVGRTARTLLDATPSASVTALATAFINDALAAKEPFILVLDDYQVISHAAVQQAVAFLLEHLPNTVHLAITSRTEPLLPIPRLRAAGDVTEIRTADLRFDQIESSAFLERMTGYVLSDEQLSALDHRVEGWPAGLQMVAISIQGLSRKSEVSDLIDDFAASRRFIFDYLVDEVLDQRPPGTQAFLLQTSMLDRLNPALCDAVTGRHDSVEQLRDLEHKNLFLFPLDNDRSWFRYHHLFAELLRRRLLQAQPDLIDELHRRASHWYEDNDYPDDAIQHALKGRRDDRAVQLCRAFSSRSLGQSNLHQAKRWLAMVPADAVRQQPQLGILSAWTLILTNELHPADACLRDAERRLAEAVSNPEIIDGWALPDPANDLARMEGEIATCRAVLARANGDVAGMLDHLKRALSLIPTVAVAQRGTALLYLGFAEWMAGDGVSALADFDAATDAGLAADRPYTAVSATTAGGRLRLERGALREAEACFRTALRLAERHTQRTGVVLPVVAEAHTGLAKLAHERADTVSARSHLDHALANLEPLGVTEDWVDASLLMARLLRVEGRNPAANDLMAAISAAVENSNVAPILRRRVRTQELDFSVRDHSGVDRYGSDPTGWNIPADGDHPTTITYLHEEELTVLARWKVVTDEIDEALDLLDRLDDATRSAGRLDRLIGVLLLKAMALTARSDIDRAVPIVSEALALGEVAGYLRTFLDEADWLRELLPLAPQTAYRDRLLAEMEGAAVGDPSDPGGRADPSTDAGRSLSERELQVLRLLATHLSGPEIARELYVSANTLKTHTRSIYRKLGVNRRSDAVTKAGTIGLI